MKKFSADYMNEHSIPEKYKHLRCHCAKRHSQQCGCFTEAFMTRSRNQLSYIISNSESPEEFAKKTSRLYYHAIDRHELCDFHPMRVCSCNECKTGDYDCEGMEYHTPMKLTCQFHKLAYKTELKHRARMAAYIIHATFKAGHSNWLEASHNILIRYLPKHIFLDRLHYELSTDLGLLQANLSYMRRKNGPSYHWIPKLYEKLGVPLFMLESYGRARDKALAKCKEEDHKKDRLEKKKERAKEGTARKIWSKEHGNDTYGDQSKKVSENTEAKKEKCKCGGNDHCRISSKLCPLNKKYKKDSDSQEKTR